MSSSAHRVRCPTLAAHAGVVVLFAACWTPAAAAPSLPQKMHDELYSVYNSSGASMVERLHAWSILSRIETALARPDFETTPANPSFASAFVAAAAGGRVVRSDGTAIFISPYVLAADTTVAISTPSADADSARLAAAEAAGLAPVSDEVVFGPVGTKLRRCAELTLKYPQGQSNAYQLRVYCWQAPANQWVRLPAQIDAAGQTATTSAFSLMPCRIFRKR